MVVGGEGESRRRLDGQVKKAQEESWQVTVSSPAMGSPIILAAMFAHFPPSFLSFLLFNSLSINPSEQGVHKI